MWRSRALEAAVMVATPVPVEMPLAVALASAYRFNEAPRCERIARIANDVGSRSGGTSKLTNCRGARWRSRLQKGWLKVDEARKDPTSNPTFSATTRNALRRHGTAKRAERLAS